MRSVSSFSPHLADRLHLQSSDIVVDIDGGGADGSESCALLYASKNTFNSAIMTLLQGPWSHSI